jgi:hypothetical protein
MFFCSFLLQRERSTASDSRGIKLSLSEAQVLFKRKYMGLYAGFNSDFDDYCVSLSYAI